MLNIKDNYSNFYKFSYSGISKSPDNYVGVYVIYFEKNCLYVGKTEEQSLRKRLKDHLFDCHNSHLKKWINSSCILKYRFIVIEDKQIIDETEKSLINYLNPHCNVRIKDGN